MSEHIPTGLEEILPAPLISQVASYLSEVMGHGYGSVTLTVREHGISTISKQLSYRPAVEPRPHTADARPPVAPGRLVSGPSKPRGG